MYALFFFTTYTQFLLFYNYVPYFSLKILSSLQLQTFLHHIFIKNTPHLPPPNISYFPLSSNDLLLILLSFLLHTPYLILFLWLLFIIYLPTSTRYIHLLPMRCNVSFLVFRYPLSTHSIYWLFAFFNLSVFYGGVYLLPPPTYYLVISFIFFFNSLVLAAAPDKPLPYWWKAFPLFLKTQNTLPFFCSYALWYLFYYAHLNHSYPVPYNFLRCISYFPRLMGGYFFYLPILLIYYYVVFLCYFYCTLPVLAAAPDNPFLHTPHAFPGIFY